MRRDWRKVQGTKVTLDGAAEPSADAPYAVGGRARCTEYFEDP